MIEPIMTTHKAFIIVGSLVVLVGLTFVVPARVVGINTHKEAPLVLKNPSELGALSEDRDGNNIPDWRDLALNSMSSTTKEAVSNVKVSVASKARLADPNNLTSSFSKNIYVASTYAKKNGGLTEPQKQELVDSILAEESKKIVVKEYTTSDLHIAKTESIASKKAYGNALGLLLKKADAYRLGSSDGAVMQAFNVKQDESVLQSLVIKRNNIDRILESLHTMSVPSSAAPSHLLLINKLSAYRVEIDSLSKAKDDPVRATIAFSSYGTVVQSLLTAMALTGKYFITENITFSKGEPGFLLISGYTK